MARPLDKRLDPRIVRSLEQQRKAYVENHGIQAHLLCQSCRLWIGCVFPVERGCVVIVPCYACGVLSRFVGGEHGLLPEIVSPRPHAARSDNGHERTCEHA